MRYLLLIVLSTFFLNSCITYKDLEYKSFEGINVEKIENGLIHIGVNIKVYNPNSYNIGVKNAIVKASYNDKDLGNIQLESPVNFDAGKATTQKIVFSFEAKKLISSAALSIFSGNSKLKLDGFLKVKVFIFSKKFPIKIEENINLGKLKF